MQIHIKRTQDTPSSEDGFRVLIEPQWPSGIPRNRTFVDEWDRDLGPSDELQAWYAHHPDQWFEYRRRYRDELEAKFMGVQDLLDRSPERTITILYSSPDDEHNNAAILGEYLDELAHRRPPGSPHA